MNYLGIDIGGTNIKAGLVSEAGEILTRRSVPTPTNLDELTAALQNLATDLGRQTVIAGVGIGCKGIVNPATAVVEVCPGAFQFLENQSLANFVRPSLPDKTPIFADNDARAMLVGEVLFGAARGAKNVLLFTLGTGLGGAILAENKIVRGARGAAGHLGHITIEPFGKMCICGNRGCLETAFSALAIESAALDAVYRGCETVLSECEKITTQAVFEAAAAGDKIAARIIADAIETLAAGIAGLLHAFDPEIVIIGGNITSAGEQLFAPLRKSIQWRTQRWLRAEVPIIPPQTAASGIVGAAGLAILAEA